MFNYEKNNSHDNFASQSYNVNTSHPLIPNSQQYMYYKKFISIHSEDRDLLKFPHSGEFEIELPEDYLNVSSLRLVDWTFPSNYNVFSAVNSNIEFCFTISNPYNPNNFDVTDTYICRIYEALASQTTPYSFLIEEGGYNPTQIATELTNKCNSVVTKQISAYFTKQNTQFPADGWATTLQQFVALGGYKRFIIVYNSVSSKIWFGNTADQFILINERSNVLQPYLCSVDKHQVPDASNWGLSGNIGLPRTNVSSVNSSLLFNNPTYELYNGVKIPRFYYGDVSPGDNGYWLLPEVDLSGSDVNWVESLYKLNLTGASYMYMEISGQNCIDETQPYNVSNFTLTTNQTNGIVNSSFAKLSVPTTPFTQWFDRDSIPYKMYYPPAERIRRLKFRIRYHNGQLVDFSSFNYSFMLEFTLMSPQLLRSSKTIVYPASK